MTNNDRIYYVFMGEMGETFQKQTCERLNWIVEQVNGCKTIIDVGCSQGIVSILMAQEGAQVTGIDIQSENIDFACRLLAEKYPNLAGRIQFICCDFVQYENAVKYDAIVITEVLEHLEDPTAFLHHAAKFLKDSAKVVITVPFGFSDHPDHCSTFFMTSLIELVEGVFYIEQISFYGRWMALIATKKSPQKFQIDLDLIRNQELNFLTIDREMSTRIQTLYQSNIEASQKYRNALEQYDRVKEWLQSSNEKLQSSQKQLQETNERLIEYKKQLVVYEKQLECNRLELEQNAQKFELFQQNLINLKINNNNLNNLNKEYADALQEQVSDIGKELDLLQSLKKTIQRLEIQNDYLKRENAEYQRKFSKITDTWYGKLALKAYRLLKKIRSIL